MNKLFSLFLLVGMWAFTVGCGGADVVEEAAPEPPPEEMEENEGMGDLPDE